MGAWRNVLIQTEKVTRVIVRLDGHHPVPTLPVRFRHAILLIAAHEIDVDPGLHGWPEPVEEAASPGNVAGIGRGLRPTGQKGQNKRRTAIAEGGLPRSNLPCC